jgi:hypothetical protein
VRAAALYAPPLDPNDPAAIETATRQTWLVVMSLLMSTVGISNSMLMAVTERYKEIGTMKCLGALDSFVVKLFFLEAGMLGVVASAIGFLIGWGLVFIINLFRLGAGVWGAASPAGAAGAIGAGDGGRRGGDGGRHHPTRHSRREDAARCRPARGGLIPIARAEFTIAPPPAGSPRFARGTAHGFGSPCEQGEP